MLALSALDGRQVSFDTTMAIIAVAIAIGQTVAASRHERRTTLLISMAVLAMLLTIPIIAKNWFDGREREQSVAAAEDSILEHPKGPSTFEDIIRSINYVQYDIVNDAMDSLIDKKKNSVTNKRWQQPPTASSTRFGCSM